MAQETQGQQVNGGARLCRHLGISENVMVYVCQQRTRGDAVKKPPVIWMESRLKQVWNQPANQADARRKK